MLSHIVNNFNFTTDLLITLSIGLVVIYLINYYKRVLSYPRGPLPLPVLGNVLLFKGSVKDYPIVSKLTDITKKFGPIYTLWVGSTPIVVVNNYELQCEASVQKRNDFIERPDIKMHEIFRGDSQNIFSTSGPYWEALRKVGIFAIRKFQTSDKLPQFVNEVMSEAVDLMVESKQPINPILYIDFMIYNIIALTAFGEKFGSIDDQQFKDAKRVNDEFYDVAGNGLITDYIPWLMPLYYKQVNALKVMYKSSVDVTKNAFIEHKKTFKPGTIRDFADCVLEAKDEAIRENYARNKYLNDNNLFMVVSDLFLAATDTTQTAMRWALLLLSNYSQIQQRIYEEIKENIGDRAPVQDDKAVLPFTSAFIMEVLRFRPSAPFGMDHYNGVDSAIGGHKIPKKTIVVFNLFAENNDPKYWTKPEVFNPNRFIDENGKLVTGRIPSFVTFGIGPRTCPGERLAFNNFFLMIVNLMQKIRIELTTGPNSADLQPLNIFSGLFPRDYQIVCHKRD